MIWLIVAQKQPVIHSSTNVRTYIMLTIS
jgi:hypothetical protein